MSTGKDIDPMREDVANRRRKRRRAKPEPRADLKAQRDAMRSRAEKRPHTPAVMLEPAEGGGWTLGPHHTDEDLWWLQIAEAFSTRSLSVMQTFLDQLIALCSEDYDEQAKRWRPNECELSAILAMVADAQPKTILQAATVAQAVALHLVSMRLGKQALNGGGQVLPVDAALLAKTTKAFAGHMDALRMMQGKSRTARQSIKVTKETHYHRHEHLHDHREGGQVIEGASHEPRAEATAERAALPSPQQGGEVVRLPSRKG